MGTTFFGLPLEATNWLANLIGLDTFVEAGTYQGDSAIAASQSFKKVITIERDDSLYEQSRERLRSFSNISIFKGCTRNHVVEHLDANDKVLFWLDAHWTFGVNSYQFDECPILDELQIIQGALISRSVILIDDARLFLAPPPLPHRKNEWPRIDELLRVVEEDKAAFIYNDVIYLIPKQYSAPFSEYLQNAITTEMLRTSHARAGSVREFIASKLRKISRK